MPKSFNRLVEPFAGMAAVSIATAQEYKTAIEKPHEHHYPKCLLTLDLDDPAVPDFHHWHRYFFFF
jgi:hypothetical protein